MRRETQNILLVLLGGALLKISFTGTYLRYVKPAHQWLLIFAGVVMLVLAAFAIARDLRAHAATADTDLDETADVEAAEPVVARTEAVPARIARTDLTHLTITDPVDTGTVPVDAARAGGSRSDVSLAGDAGDGVVAAEHSGTTVGGAVPGDGGHADVDVVGPGGGPAAGAPADLGHARAGSAGGHGGPPVRGDHGGHNGNGGPGDEYGGSDGRGGRGEYDGLGGLDGCDGNDGHGGHGGHDGHDEHSHSTRSAWLLALPVFAVFLVAPPALGADSVQRAADTAPRVAAASEFDGSSLYPPLPTGDVIALQLTEFVERAAWDSADSLDDRRIRLTGFVVHEGDGGYLARMAIGCCAADAYPVKVRLDGADLAGHPDDSWIEVVVEVVPDTATKATEYVPSASVHALRPVPEPKDPYEH